MDIAQALLTNLREAGQKAGVQVTTEIVTGSRVVDTVVERAAQDKIWW